MEKFIPYEKLSKKEKRKLDNARRQTWGALNPTTRKSDNIKVYNRKKRQDWKKELPGSVAFGFYKAYKLRSSRQNQLSFSFQKSMIKIYTTL